VIGVWSSAADASFETAMRQAFRRVRVESVSFRNRHLGETQTDWVYLGEA